ncbi:hypothetical protein [Salinigranum sp. GCM10025319]|uniref:hypothetical protein n=1 Tax=Salinigranum sp. GCM10025319 TaxID=3252687 RepID=UPI00360844D6
MGLLDSTRGGTVDDDPTTETDAAGTGDADPTESNGGRRWLAVAFVGLVAVGLTVYLRSRQRAAREAEFTEIELESTGSESESESESASTE